jgi:TonB family protein
MQRAAVLFAAAALAFPLYGANRKLIGSLLNNAYKNQIVTLRAFYDGSTLQYSPDGTFLKGGKPGPWTLDACVRIQSVSLGSKQLRITGRRLWFVYEQKQKKLVPGLGPQVTVAIASKPAGVSISSLQAAMSKVFLTGTENFVNFVPDYWKPYLLHPEMSTEEIDAALGLRPYHAVKSRRRVMAGKRIGGVGPRYLEDAKRAGISGTVFLGVTIGPDGKIRREVIIQPVGMGLDDEAVKAIETWRYRPTMLNGIPVRVVTRINVKYQMER